jgi:glycosyltransferase involved in cell wall biosynthesis
MKLLIITQKVDKNDSVLGFFHRWISEFSKHYDSVLVICLYKGEYSLPSNVKVISLGKESGVSRIKYIFNLYKYIWLMRHEYDRVFVHMNQIYILLGGLLWKLLSKDIYLWYTHKSVTASLKFAVYLVKGVFSASSESFRVPTKKLQVMGHGIDLDLFSMNTRVDGKDSTLKLITVGRISRSKDILTILKAISIVKDRVRLEVLGGTQTIDDNLYLEEIKKYIVDNHLDDKVSLLGPMPQDKIIIYIKNADLFVHTSVTGSLDKAPLESLACGTLVVSCNDSFVPILEKYNLIFKSGDPQSLANVILNFKNDVQVKIELRKYIESQHSLVKLISNLSARMNSYE